MAATVAKSLGYSSRSVLYSAFVGVETPGQDGMRRAPFPISNAVSNDFCRVRVSGVPGLLGTAALIVNNGLHRLEAPVGLTLMAVFAVVNHDADMLHPLDRHALHDTFVKSVSFSTNPTSSNPHPGIPPTLFERIYSQAGL